MSRYAYPFLLVRIANTRQCPFNRILLRLAMSTGLWAFKQRKNVGNLELRRSPIEDQLYLIKVWFLVIRE